MFHQHKKCTPHLKVPSKEKNPGGGASLFHAKVKNHHEKKIVSNTPKIKQHGASKKKKKIHPH